jgi:hypothetical protein
VADFVTKDSGQRQEYSTGMRRDTQEGKPRFDLIVPAHLPYEEQYLTRLAGLMERGAVKYGERNFEKARTWQELARFRNSAFRHFMQWFTAVDDGEDHAAAVAFNIIAAEYVWYHLQHPEARHPNDGQQIPGELKSTNPQEGDVIYHHHDDPLTLYYMAEDDPASSGSAIHKAMKPHKHDTVDGKQMVIPL